MVTQQTQPVSQSDNQALPFPFYSGNSFAYLALGQLGLDGGPGLGLGGVAEQVHDDGAAGDGLVDLEEVLAGDPAILLGVLPGLAVLPDADDDVQAVVAQVQALAVALGAVADEGEGVVLEVLLLLRKVVCEPLDCIEEASTPSWGSWGSGSLLSLGNSQATSPWASRHAL